MSTAVKHPGTRRFSVPAVPPGGSILKIKAELDLPSEDRRRKVSFERVVPVKDSNHSSGSTPGRRHSSVQAPSAAALTPRPGQPLEKLSEAWVSLEPQPSASHLIEACIKDAEVMINPDPLPHFSTDMEAVLRELQGQTCDDYLTITDEESQKMDSENRDMKINGHDETSNQQQEEQRTVENQRLQSVRQQDMKRRQRRVSAPVTKAPNINQLTKEK